ncbi:MAG: hypothetical protein ACR2HP_16270 [Ilumatobacteraceae bacterium]
MTVLLTSHGARGLVGLASLFAVKVPHQLSATPRRSRRLLMALQKTVISAALCESGDEQRAGAALCGWGAFSSVSP